MTQIEEYRMKRLVPQLKKLAKEYPMKTLDNIIRNIEDRMEYYKTNNKRKK